MENMPQDCIIGTNLMPSILEGGMLDLNTFQMSNKVTGEIFKEFQVMGMGKITIPSRSQKCFCAISPKAERGDMMFEPNRPFSINTD